MKSLKLIFSSPRYLGPALVFASLNFIFGTWAIYIPSVKNFLSIDKAALGVAIFCLAMGTFSVLPFAAPLIRRVGVGVATAIGVLGISASAFLPFLATDYTFLLLALFLLGATQGFTDIAMNGLVSEIEKQDQKSVMSATHGFFSLGGVLAGMGSFLIPVFSSPMLHMGVVVVLVVVAHSFYFRSYVSIEAGIPPKQPVSLHQLKPLFLLGLISFVVMGSEGAIVDWSGLFLQELVGAPEYLIGAGFLLFSFCMTIARFFGDMLSDKIGGRALILLGALVAIFGYVLVLQQELYMSLIGFALNGLGFSVIIPEVFRLAGKRKDIETAKAIAITAGFGYSGFLITPVILGFVAKTFGLSVSFQGLLGAVVIVFLMGLFSLKRNKTNGVN
jgi:fucose permease